MESANKETILLYIDLFISDVYDLMKAVFPDIVENKEKSIIKEYPKERGSIKMTTRLKIIAIKELLFKFIQEKVSDKIYDTYADLINSISYFRNKIKSDLDKKNHISFFVQIYFIMSSIDYF